MLYMRMKLQQYINFIESQHFSFTLYKSYEYLRYLLQLSFPALQDQYFIFKQIMIQSMEENKPLNSSSNNQKTKTCQNICEFLNSDELVFYSQQLSRVEGEQLEKPIHRSIVAITFLDANKNVGTGSGVLISKNVVLTAAQNIFDKELNAENTDFKIYIGVNGVAEEYHQVWDWKYPEEFKTCNKNAKLTFNYAIMKLKKSVQMLNYVGLSLACIKCLIWDNKKTEIKVFGFPSVYPPDTLDNVRPFQDNFKPLDASGKIMKLYQYGLARVGVISVIEAENSKVGYRISTLPGQAGCPVVHYGRIFAVHVGGDNSKFNVGRIVDVSFMNSLWKWREQLNAAPFQLQDQNVCKHIEQSLKKMRYKLDLSRKKLKEVKMIEHSNLLDLDLSYNQLRQINLAHCSRLTILNLNNNRLWRIDLSQLKHLIKLYLSSNQLRTMDLSGNINLTRLHLSNNQLRNIDLSANVNLSHLWLENNKLQEMDLSANANLNVLQLSRNQIKKLRTSVNLTEIKLSSIQLQEIDLRVHVNLTKLYLNNNKLQEIDVRSNSNLTQLYLQDNQLQSIDVRANVNLTVLDLSYNKLRGIDVRTNVNLTRLDSYKNQLQEIDLRANLNLTSLFLNSNKLEDIDLRINVNLAHLGLNFNRIAEIDLTKNTKLKQLQFQGNRLERVHLGIAENVREESYTNSFFFDFCNQSSAVCRVEVQCENQRQEVREKAIRIVDKWMQKYSANRFNRHNCAYSFLVF